MATADTLDFAEGQKIVYPAHGVGTVTAIEQQQVAGMTLEVYVVSFDQDKMILRVPTEAGRRRTQNPRRQGPHQAHHVVAPRSGV